MLRSLSIVIPAFNESARIVRTLEEVTDYLETHTLAPTWDIVVVNDGSTDDTLAQLEGRAAALPWLKVVDLGGRKGRGTALRAGLRAAKGEVVISLDADLSYAPYHIERMVRAMEDQGADLVLASAYAPGGTVRNVPIFRSLLSRWGNLTLAFMFQGGIHTLTCLARAYRKTFIDSVDLHSADKDIHLEIIAKTRTLGGQIVEVPADLHWREEKLLKRGGPGGMPRRSTLKVRSTSKSHLFFALLNRPGLIFWFPGCLMMGIFAVCLALIVYSILVTNGPTSSVFQAMRTSMLQAAPTWLTLLASFVIGVQFFTLGFLTNQNKRNQEDLYRTLNAIYNQTRDRDRADG